MIILAFTDIHGDERALAKVKKKSKHADLVLCAGDLTIFENRLRKILSEVNSFGKAVLVIHGNHEGEAKMRKECERFKNIIFLHKNFYEKDGIVFSGFGGGGFLLRDRHFERFSGKIQEKAKGKGLVLMLHGPPYKTKTDLIMHEHAGSISYTDFIRYEKPNLVICGHLHENNGKKDYLGKTLIINPGPEGKLINLR